MIADYFTKPLQGALFKKLRDVIMGHTHPSSLLKPSGLAPSPCKERVGISMPAEATSRIVGKMSSVPSDGPSENNGLNHARMNIIQKPTYADIVREVESTARRKSDQTIS